MTAPEWILLIIKAWLTWMEASRIVRKLSHEDRSDGLPDAGTRSTGETVRGKLAA